MTQPSDDPRRELRQLTQSGKVQLTNRAVDEATPVQAQLMLMVNRLHDTVDALRSSNDSQFGEAFSALRDVTTEASAARLEASSLRTDVVGIKSSIENEIKPRLQGIEDKQTIANGSVGKLKAQVEVIEKERAKQDRQMRTEVTTEVIEQQADEVANKGVWIIPKPNFRSWKTWSTILGLFTFFGIERLIAIIHLIGVLLSKIH